MADVMIKQPFQDISNSPRGNNIAKPTKAKAIKAAATPQVALLIHPSLPPRAPALLPPPLPPSDVPKCYHCGARGGVAPKAAPPGAPWFCGQCSGQEFNHGSWSFSCKQEGFDSTCSGASD